MGFEGRPADLDSEGRSEHHAMKCLWSMVKNIGQELQMLLVNPGSTLPSSVGCYLIRKMRLIAGPA